MGFISNLECYLNCGTLVSIVVWEPLKDSYTHTPSTAPASPEGPKQVIIFAFVRYNHLPVGFDNLKLEDV